MRWTPDAASVVFDMVRAARLGSGAVEQAASLNRRWVAKRG